MEEVGAGRGKRDAGEAARGGVSQGDSACLILSPLFWQTSANEITDPNQRRPNRGCTIYLEVAEGKEWLLHSMFWSKKKQNLIGTCKV